MRPYIERCISVKVLLDQSNYDHAIQAHKSNVMVVVTGNLEQFGVRWRLRNPYIKGVIPDEDSGSHYGTIVGC